MLIPQGDSVDGIVCPNGCCFINELYHRTSPNYYNNNTCIYELINQDNEYLHIVEQVKKYVRIYMPIDWDWGVCEMGQIVSIYFASKTDKKVCININFDDIYEINFEDIILKRLTT